MSWSLLLEFNQFLFFVYFIPLNLFLLKFLSVYLFYFVGDGLSHDWDSAFLYIESIRAWYQCHIWVLKARLNKTHALWSIVTKLSRWTLRIPDNCVCKRELSNLRRIVLCRLWDFWAALNLSTFFIQILQFLLIMCFYGIDFQFTLFNILWNLILNISLISWWSSLLPFTSLTDWLKVKRINLLWFHWSASTNLILCVCFICCKVI